MRRTRLAASIAMAVLMPSPLLAATSAVPDIPVRAHCEAVQKRASAPDRVLEACLRDEEAARAQLDGGVWAKAKASSRDACEPNRELDKNGSYMEILGCVQLLEGVVLRPADQQAPGKPASQP